MAYTRRRKTSSSTTIAKKSKTHSIDGVTYKSKALMKLHETWTKDELVESFSLPSVQDEKENKNIKYGAKKCVINNLVFDSVMEGRYYVMLLHLIQEGTVTSFERQVTFILQDKYRNPFTGKAISAIKYIADFILIMPDGAQVVIDVKGIETADFLLKKKMFGYRYKEYQFMCVQWSERDKEWQDLEDIKARRRKNKKEKNRDAA